MRRSLPLDSLLPAGDLLCAACMRDARSADALCANALCATAGLLSAGELLCGSTDLLLVMKTKWNERQ